MNKITALEIKSQQKTTKTYSAVISGKNKISVFDVDKGVVSYVINVGSAEIINGPVITRDKLTIVVKDRTGKTICKVYSLKSGVQSYSFTVSK